MEASTAPRLWHSRVPVEEPSTASEGHVLGLANDHGKISPGSPPGLRWSYLTGMNAMELGRRLILDLFSLLRSGNTRSDRTTPAISPRHCESPYIGFEGPPSASSHCRRIECKRIEWRCASFKFPFLRRSDALIFMRQYMRHRRIRSDDSSNCANVATKTVAAPAKLLIFLSSRGIPMRGRHLTEGQRTDCGRLPKECRLLVHSRFPPSR